jgi:DNA-binding CsgD family transcriptional regulator
MDQNIIDQLPVNIGWKDLQLQHQGCNMSLAKNLELKTPSAIIGLRDADIESHSEEDVRFHYQNDQLALQGELVKFVHYFQDSFFFSVKKPLLDIHKQVTGVIYQCHLIEPPDILKTLIQDHQGKKKTCYRIQPEKNPFSLSNRELQCLFHLLHGKSSKQIAAVLNLSKRTIDGYLDSIKIKFGCLNKFELIIAAIEAGYLMLAKLQPPPV